MRKTIVASPSFRSRFAVGAALAASAVLGASSALALPCVTADWSVYLSGGFSCNVGPVSFSNFSVAASASTQPPNGSASIEGGTFSPFISGNEFGLISNYTMNASNASATAELIWQYDVSSALGIADALMALTGSTTGSASARASETLSNGSGLDLLSPGSVTGTFAPVSALSVAMHQIDSSTATGTSATSLSFTDAFSVPVPEPASLSLVGLALAGLAFTRRRKQ